MKHHLQVTRGACFSYKW